MTDQDIQDRIDEISARMSETLLQIEQITKDIVESKTNIMRLELEILNDRITEIENNKKNHESCEECSKCTNHCRCEINFMNSDLFLSK